VTPPFPPLGKCTRRVGFLFPHECERLTPDGCPDCQNGAVDDPYVGYDRYGYTSYDDYGDDYYIGSGFQTGLVAGALNEATDEPADDASMEFTEADGADLVQPDDQFENDMTES